MPNKLEAKALATLVDDLRAAYSKNLNAVVLYGSQAAGDSVAGRSDLNLLIVLDRITPEALRLGQGWLREWQELGQPRPVYFTAEEVAKAADVFPIEFLQMEQARKVLYGPDPFESVEISRANLRHQTEYELRTRLIQLRRLYVRASGSGTQLFALMRDSLTSFAALFRAALILMGQEPPIAKADSVRAAVSLLGLDGQPFERILEIKSNEQSDVTEKEANEVFAAYLEQIERVIAAVDQIDKA
jgi:hypothetical protein